MGLKLTKTGSQPYFVNYERSFDKIEQEIYSIQNKIATSQKLRSSYQFYLTVFALMTTAISLFFTSKIIQAPEGTYTWKEQLQYVSPTFALPILSYLTFLLRNALVRYRIDSYQNKLRKLKLSKSNMLKELRDNTHYDQIQRLLQKYDQDERELQDIRSQIMKRRQQLTSANKSLNTLQSSRSVQSWQGEGEYGVAKENMGPQNGNMLGTQNANLIQNSKTKRAKQSRAGKLIMPFIENLANLMGDDPILIEQLKKAKSAVMLYEKKALEASQKLQILQQENQQLRRQLGLSVDEDENKDIKLQTSNQDKSKDLLYKANQQDLQKNNHNSNEESPQNQNSNVNLTKLDDDESHLERNQNLQSSSSEMSLQAEYGVPKNDEQKWHDKQQELDFVGLDSKKQVDIQNTVQHQMSGSDQKIDQGLQLNQGSILNQSQEQKQDMQKINQNNLHQDLNGSISANSEPDMATEQNTNLNKNIYSQQKDAEIQGTKRQRLLKLRKELEDKQNQKLSNIDTRNENKQEFQQQQEGDEEQEQKQVKQSKINLENENQLRQRCPSVVFKLQEQENNQYNNLKQEK